MSLEELCNVVRNTMLTAFLKKDSYTAFLYPLKKVVHFANFGRYEVVFLTKCYGLRSRNDFKKVSI